LTSLTFLILRPIYWGMKHWCFNESLFLASQMGIVTSLYNDNKMTFLKRRKA